METNNKIKSIIKSWKINNTKQYNFEDRIFSFLNKAQLFLLSVANQFEW